MSTIPEENRDLQSENTRLRAEVAYLRFLVWKLSVRDLAAQHDKYKPWLARTYVGQAQGRGVSA